MVFPIGSTPFGASYSDWTIRWWRWLLSIPKNRNPALDASGEFCGIFQNNPNVWFLAGTFGGLVERKCTIPVGKAVFMPLINYQCSFVDSISVTTEIELEAKCREEIDDIRNLNFRFNHLTLGDAFAYRVHSPVFVICLIKNNVLGADPGITHMASDGFWIFLKPLQAGKYEISSLASCRSGKIKIGASYEILIE
jgi:hypothetical protein